MEQWQVKTALIRAFTLALATAVFLSHAIPASGERPPVGVYIWHPEPGGPRSNADCDALSAQLHPSAKQAEDWLSGIAGDFDPETGPYYLIVSKDRMETTFSSEGDYDTGAVTFGQAASDLTPFTLVPDDHPNVTITGAILAPSNSLIVTVTLKDVPLEEGARGRIVIYCRFVDGEVT